MRIRYLSKMTVSVCLFVAMGGLVCASASAEKPVIRIGYFPSLRSMAIVRADHLIEKRGYKVKWTNFPGYAHAEAAAAAAGAIDFAQADTSGLMQMDLKSPGLYWYVANVTSNYVGIIAGKNSGIKSISDLEGKSVGGVIPNSAPYAVLRMALAQHNVDYSSLHALNVIGAGQGPALEKGAIQAAVTWVPWESILLANGTAKLLTTATQTYGKTWPGGGVVVRPEFAKKHPEAVVAVVSAVIEATHMLKNHPSQAYDAMAKGAKYKLSDVKYSFTHHLVNPLNALPDKAALQEQAEVLVKYGVIHPKHGVDHFIGEFVHPEFVRKAQKASGK